MFIGNIAYEAGNISGTSMGLETFIGNYTYNFLNIDVNFIPVFIGIILLLIVGNGNYKIFEKFLVFLVSMMSLTFIFLAIISKPNLSDLLNGLVPSVNDKNFVYFHIHTNFFYHVGINYLFANRKQ